MSKTEEKAKIFKKWKNVQNRRKAKKLRRKIVGKLFLNWNKLKKLKNLKK